ncbi:transglutaminase domain-containing protein [Parahaliea aestuarii]|uniref:Tetratricopeptide repeat protein n=1 Tax=Parahaliea aestuarii TaxID=1852021 RepID=A0A5C8ZUR8_9GAMM|nr:transglutaminase domain-containing protein [Parahaliea aestuarii]TXS92238.1 tetratricopeptide repeat protein [Parahaliea aestuarii]
MTHFPRLRLFTTALLLSCLGACAGQSSMVHSPRYSPEELLQGSRFGLQPAALEPVDLLAVNDDMRAFLRQHVPEGVNDRRKVELILAAILDDGLNLTYNNFRTFTAEEAFYSREGNCMSFTNLFVALAREAGVNVRFQEVTVPPTWSARGETWLFNLHINALVDLPSYKQVVDFNLDDYNREFHRRQLTDREALARYHNNMGVHWMTGGEGDRAFAHFQRAIQLRPGTGYFYTNLGTLYRRLGQDAAAESAYLTAIDIDEEPVAYSNLARLYAARGDSDRASYYRQQVDLFRSRNPYYLFYLAEEAYAEADYVEAEDLLRKALRQHSKDHRIYRLMGLVHLRQGDHWLAEKRFRQAAELADNDDEALARYNHKLELLAQH